MIAQYGAWPGELNRQVPKKIEDAGGNVTRVQHIKSVVTNGVSITSIVFRLGANTEHTLTT